MIHIKQKQKNKDGGKNDSDKYLNKKVSKKPTCTYSIYLTNYKRFNKKHKWVITESTDYTEKERPETK